MADSTNYLRALYAGNMLWHTSAIIHFGFRPAHMMSKLSLRHLSSSPSISASRSGDSWHHDLMAYLAGMNSPMALLAGVRLYSLFRPDANRRDLSLDVLALTLLGLANASQAVLNFTLGRGNDRWIVGKGLDRITVLDAAFTVLDWGVAGWMIGLGQ